MTNARSFFKDKRGIHPLATIILITAVFLAIVGIVYLWKNMETRAGHAIWIHNVEFEDSRTLIYVQNVGEGSVVVASVEINNEEFNVSPINCTVSLENTTTLKSGHTAQITINQAYHEEVHIKVVCKDGTSHQGDWKP